MLVSPASAIAFRCGATIAGLESSAALAATARELLHPLSERISRSVWCRPCAVQPSCTLSRSTAPVAGRGDRRSPVRRRRPCWRSCCSRGRLPPSPRRWSGIRTPKPTSPDTRSRTGPRAASIPRRSMSGRRPRGPCRSAPVSTTSPSRRTTPTVEISDYSAEVAYAHHGAGHLERHAGVRTGRRTRDDRRLGVRRVAGDEHGVVQRRQRVSDGLE